MVRFTTEAIHTIMQLAAESRSERMRLEGAGVVVFEADGDIEAVLLNLGFRQDIRKDKFNLAYGHTCWWNGELLVTNVPGLRTWTVANENGPLMGGISLPAMGAVL